MRQHESPGTKQRTLQLPSHNSCSNWKEAKLTGTPTWLCKGGGAAGHKARAWMPGTVPAETQNRHGSGGNGSWTGQDTTCTVQGAGMAPEQPQPLHTHQGSTSQAQSSANPGQNPNPDSPVVFWWPNTAIPWHWELIWVPSTTSRLFWSSLRRWNLFYWSVFFSSKHRHWKLKTKQFAEIQ